MRSCWDGHRWDRTDSSLQERFKDDQKQMWTMLNQCWTHVASWSHVLWLKNIKLVCFYLPFWFVRPFHCLPVVSQKAPLTNNNTCMHYCQTLDFNVTIHRDWLGLTNMSLSENSVPLHPMVLLIIIPIFMAISLGVYPIFRHIHMGWIIPNHTSIYHLYHVCQRWRWYREWWTAPLQDCWPWAIRRGEMWR